MDDTMTAFEKRRPQPDHGHRKGAFMPPPSSDAGIIDMLWGLGLREMEVRHHANAHGSPTGVRIVSLRDWSQREHPQISEIAGSLPTNCALEVIFEMADPEGIWAPPRQPDPWSASMRRGRRR